MPSAGGCNRPRSGVARPCPFAACGIADSGTGETSPVHQGKIFAASAGGISGTAQTLLGAAHVGTGIFLCDGGAVDEATIKAYIENQKWDEDDEGFKITAPTEP